MKSIQIIVSGTVQGVFFRSNIKKKAIELGLTGYARNLSNGAVEVVAEGEYSKLNELINFIKSNPGHSKVEDIKINYKESESFSGFEIK